MSYMLTDVTLIT